VKSNLSLWLKFLIYVLIVSDDANILPLSLISRDYDLSFLAISSSWLIRKFNLNSVSSIFLRLNYLAFNYAYILSASSSSKYKNSSSINIESRPAQLELMVLS
jgi:hypothetical protein